MKTIFKTALLTFAVIFWGTSCKDSNDTPEDRIEINPATLTFEHEGGSLQFSVESNTAWTIDKSGCSWVTTNVSSGTGDQTVTVTAPENTQGHRTGKLVLTAGDKSKELSITQHSAVLSFSAPSLSGTLKSNLPIPGETRLVIPYSGGIGNETFTISVTATDAGINDVSNFAVTLTTPAGEILIPLSGTPAAPGETTFTFTTTYANPTTNAILTIPALQATIEVGTPPVLTDTYPLEFRTPGMNQLEVTSNDGVTTLTTIGDDPNIYTSTLGRPLSDGIKRVIAFEYTSNRTVTNAEFFYCVSGGPEGGKSSGQTITIPEALEWIRFEFDLSEAINSFGFGVNNSGGREPADHLFRFDPTGAAGYEISIRNFQIEIYSNEP